MEIIVLLLLTVPIFYIWGIISFIRSFSRSDPQPQNYQPTNRKEFLKSIIAEMQSKQDKNPDVTLAELLQTYRTELESIKDIATVTTSSETVVQTHAAQPATASVGNWYKDNSINLLLYIGAFLIVVSAAFFVSSDVTSNIMKGSVLTLLTLLFYLSGLWFHTIQRIRNAGSAFAGIGALLIPVTGFGWYNFVFQANGVSLGIVWLVTSVVGLFAYIVLARYFKSAFYSYVTSLSSISFSLAFVSTQGLQNDFYILASILSAVLLLSVSIYFRENKHESTELFREPFALTANAVLPIAIAYSLFLTSDKSTFSLEATLSIFLGCIFYCISYFYFKKPWHIAAAQILFTLTLIHWGFWLKATTVNVLYLVTVSVCLNVYLAYLFTHIERKREARTAAMLSVVKAAIVCIFLQTLGLVPLEQLFFAAIPFLIGLILTDIRKTAYHLVTTILSSAALLYILTDNVLKFSDKPFVLGFLYTAFAVGWYMLAVRYKARKAAVEVFALGTILFFVLSIFTLQANWQFQLVNALAMSIASLSASYRFGNKTFLYLANGLFGYTTYILLQLLITPFEYYPVAFVALAFVFYLVGTVLPKSLRQYFINSGLLGAALVSAIWGLYSLGADYDPAVKATEFSALIASYATTLLFGFDAYNNHSKRMGYVASAIGILTYLWQMHYLNVTETLYYTLVIGGYFFVLSYLQRTAKTFDLKRIFDFLAIIFLVAPTWFQSFGGTGILYAGVLGLIGVGFIVFSITYEDKWYRYAGILTIVLAVLSQSTWAVIGLAGIGFLGLAFYLLLLRNDRTK